MDDFGADIDLFQQDAAQTDDAADPETDEAPLDDQAPDEEEADAQPDETEPTEESDASAQTDEQSAPEPQAPQEPPIPWDNPTLVAMRREAEQFQRIALAAQEAQQIQAQRQIADKLVEFSDGDMTRYNELLGTIAQVTQPLRNSVNQFENRAVTSEKTLTAFLLAVEAVAPEQVASIKTTFNELMQVEGPQTMQKLAFAEHENAKKYAPILSEKDAQIAKLQKQLQATAKVGAKRLNGANVVDQGSAPNARTGANAGSMDEFFDDIFAGTKYRATG